MDETNTDKHPPSVRATLWEGQYRGAINAMQELLRQLDKVDLTMLPSPEDGFARDAVNAGWRSLRVLCESEPEGS